MHVQRQPCAYLQEISSYVHLCEMHIGFIRVAYTRMHTYMRVGIDQHTYMYMLLHIPA